MSDHESPTTLQKPGVTPAPGGPARSNAPRCPEIPAVLGLLAGDKQKPHEGERAIVASAIWNALQCCTVDELPSVSRLVEASYEDLRSRAQYARDLDVTTRGSVRIAPFLALCAQIHRAGFIDADGKQARSLLFLALVDLAIHCTDLIRSTSFERTANGLRIQLERLAAEPKLTDRFVRNLEMLLRNGVKVYIGYGLVDENGRDKAGGKLPITPKADRDLKDLEKRFKNFTFSFIGNTHRKVLVSDCRYAVTTSFNWLSFKGDPREKPRDEAGIYIAKPDYIESTFTDCLDLIRKGYVH